MALAGTCTTTYKKKLLCRHPEWLEYSKILYNQVLNFYYGLLKAYPEIAVLSSQKALRELERLTIPGREKNLPKEPLPFDKVPLYFRRAAINAAVGMMHSYLEKHKNWELNEKKDGEPMPAAEICASPVFYKGMYKEFSEDCILLKVYTGKVWCWIKCRLKGRKLPDEGERLSPCIVIGKKFSMLHIPIKQQVEDRRSAKERVEAGEKICAVTFSNRDAHVVCVVCHADGSAAATRFIRGGREYAHHSKRLIEKIKRDRKVMGKSFDWTGASRRDWLHLKRLKEHYAHRASRKILDFCKAHGVKVIAFTISEEKMPRYIQKNLPGYSPYLLGGRIKEQLFYKALREGILVTGVRAHYTANKCSLCRSYLIKENKPGSMYRCKAGHTGNRDLNTAKNIAVMCLKKYGKLMEKQSMQIQFA